MTVHKSKLEDENISMVLGNVIYLDKQCDGSDVHAHSLARALTAATLEKGSDVKTRLQASEDSYTCSCFQSDKTYFVQ